MVVPHFNTFDVRSRRAQTLRRAMVTPVIEELEVRCLLAAVALNPDVSYAVNTKPTAIVAGAFGPGPNVDIIATSNTTNLAFLPGNGDGTFGLATNINAGFVATSMVAAQLTNDGNLDLVATDVAANSVAIMLGNGDGTFKSASLLGLAAAPGKVTVADVNGDGIPDIIVPIMSKNEVSILLGNGNGTFQGAVSYAAGTSPVAVAAADFNGDGYTDLAVADQGATQGVDVLINDGVTSLTGNVPGQFSGTPIFTALPDKPYSIITADLNGDFAPDIEVAGGTSTSGLIFSILGTGYGTFAAPQVFPTGNSPQTILAGDLNGDGKVDLTTVDESADGITVLPGAGDGTFQSAQAFGVQATGAQPEAGVIADFNGDNRSDVAVADFNNGMVTVFINAGGYTPVLPPPPQLISPTEGATLNPTVNAAFSWSVVPGAASYNVDFLLGGFFSFSENSSTVTLSVPVSNFLQGATYEWEVQAVNGGGTAGLPSGPDFFINPAVPPGPTPVTPGSYLSPGTTISNLTPTFLWDSVVNAADYTLTIYLGTSSTVVDSIGGISGTIEPLSSGILQYGTDYSWSVTADLIDGSITNPGTTYYFSTESAIPTLAGPTLVSPGTPTNTGSLIATETPQFTWDQVSGASRYALYVDSGSSTVYSNTQIGGTIFTLPTGYLTQGGNYSWHMNTYNSAGVAGPASSSLFFSTPSPAPILAPPTALSPGTSVYSGATSTSLTPTFTWTPVANASRYGLYLSVFNGALLYFNRQLSGTSFQLPSGTLAVGDTYSWYMVTFNSDGVAGSAGNSLIFSSPSAAPILPGPTLLTPSGTISTLSPTFTWSPVSGAVSYQLTIQTGGNTVYTNNAITGTIFTIPDGFLQNSMTYTWSMVTVNTDGIAGSASSTVLFNTATNASSEPIGPFVVQEGYILYIVGTTLNDTIEVADSNNAVYAIMNGMTSESFPASGLRQVQVNGNSGDDLITVDSTAISCSVQGGPGNDTIVGDNANDTIGGGQGNDSIVGGPGQDLIHGGQGDDTIVGGAGNDTIYGGLGNNTITAGNGDNVILGGGSGNDVIFANNNRPDTIYGGTASNTTATIDFGQDVLFNVQTIL